MGSSKSQQLPESIDDTTLEDEELATHQETIPVPYIAGTRMVALRWLGPAYDMVTRQAPDDRPGKK